MEGRGSGDHRHSGQPERRFALQDGILDVRRWHDPDNRSDHDDPEWRNGNEDGLRQEVVESYRLHKRPRFEVAAVFFMRGTESAFLRGPAAAKPVNVARVSSL